MKSRWIDVWSVALLCVVVFAHAAHAQDAPAPQDDTEAARAAEADEDPADDSEFLIGLYVEVGAGAADYDTLDTTLRTSSTQVSDNLFTLEDADYRRFAAGWNLPDKKGRFRLVWQGINENGYDFTAVGRAAQANSGGAPVVEELAWWLLKVEDGQLDVAQTPPAWTPLDDTNMDGNVQQDEVSYPATTFQNTTGISPDLQNRAQVTDFLFGNVFGPRRVEGVWWGGLRYFAYEGTLLQGAWLRSQGALGQGFTEGALIKLVTPSQETTGIGPTGSLGFRVNFFEKRLQLYAQGQFAFLLSDVEVDTGTFVTYTNASVGTTILTGEARLIQERDRTSWHTHIEGGLRVNLKSGLIFEATYYAGGFLDAVLTPTENRIPQTAQELANGTSAIFATQDLRYDGWRSSIAFQF